MTCLKLKKKIEIINKNCLNEACISNKIDIETILKVDLKFKHEDNQTILFNNRDFDLKEYFVNFNNINKQEIEYKCNCGESSSAMQNVNIYRLSDVFIIQIKRYCFDQVNIINYF